MESTYLAQGLAQHHTPSPRLEKERLPNYNLVKKIQNCIYMSWEYQKRDLKKLRSLEESSGDPIVPMELK